MPDSPAVPLNGSDAFRLVTCPWADAHQAFECTKHYKRHDNIWIECHVCKKSGFGRKVKKDV